MILTLQRLKLLFLLIAVTFLGEVRAQECEHLGLVSRGFLLGQFNCEVLIISSDGVEVFQPIKLSEELTPGSIIQFSYEILDSTDCADDIPLINITCVTPFLETVDSILSTCNFDIESTILPDSLGNNTYQLEVYNQTDFGAYHPQSVQWYEYETGKTLGTEPIIVFTPTATSPPVINICADITVLLPDGIECKSTLCHTIIPETILPNTGDCQALFVYQPKDQLASNGAINFYNLSFGDYNQVIWDFGDGQMDTTNALTFEHTYQSPGLYEVCLTLVDDMEICSSSFCLPVFTVGGSEICNFNECVLPGDANIDGTVNIFDVLNIGVGFNTAGEVRPNAVIDPILQAAFDWDFQTVFSLNFKHIDCDGNGMVDAADYAAIDQNYQKVIADRNFEVDETLPQIAIEFPADTLYVNPNQTEISIPASLVMGTADQPINNFYGIAVSFDYAGAPIKTVESTYNTASFIGPADKTFTKTKLLEEDAQLGFAVTRTDQIGMSGSGNIADFAFILELDILDGRSASSIELDINNLTPINPNGEEIPASVPEDGPRVVIIFDENLSVSTEEQLAKQQLDIYPNPAKEVLRIDVAKEINLADGYLEIFNTLGQRVITQTITTHQTILSINTLESGVYWIKIYTEDGIGVREVIIE